MHLSDVRDLHNITPIENLESIMRRGILSHRRAEPYRHRSVALASVQDRRSRVLVPDGTARGRPLHEYANLYFDARNPMMSRRRDMHRQLAVLEVTRDILVRPGIVVTSGNAASELPHFWPVPLGLERLDANEVYAEWWLNPDPDEQRRRAIVRCAEVLVPDRVPAEDIIGVIVSCREAEAAVRAAGVTLPIRRSGKMFFQ